MRLKSRVFQLVILLLGLGLSYSCWADSLGFLNPKGWVSSQERALMFDTAALMLIVVLPVIFMSFAFAYRYRAKKRKGQFRPEWSHSTILEVFWWGIPTIIIVLLK